ncbi:type II toxin-antitoxin system HicB family antitoxin [Dyadobacter sp. CY326]|uniref:type II toxin-antitoxin system HicB family antitoxin n=1 Tax=Dyadobacter sp. CY326 TaxID=2907300 RepID=UPI001F3DCC22|nr:type II toxin-antitoxin system HicB family antitoxin [Dyadobacter sp. CY326]MCE7068470.1 type II toxin-antitoxin system HicB family antitoxin [Dyadobacter sp. CY326]
MKIIKVVIARSKDFFGAHSENVRGINGGGETIKEVKESILECIEIIKTFDEKNIPAALKGEYEIEWKLDVGSFLTYYKGIFSQTGIARLTGINEKQLNHYASGLKKPRPAQARRIEAALHQLGSELLALKL